MKLGKSLTAVLSALALYSGNVSAAQPEPKKVDTIQKVDTKPSSSHISKTSPSQTRPTDGTSVSTWTPTTVKVDGKERQAYVIKADRKDLYCFEPTPQDCEDKYKPVLCVKDECQGKVVKEVKVESTYDYRLTGGFLMKFDQDENGLAESPKGAYVSLSFQPHDKRYFGGLELSVAGDSETKTRTIANGLGEQKRTKDLVDLALTAHLGCEPIPNLYLTFETGLVLALANEKLTEIGKSQYWDDTLTSGKQNTQLRWIVGGKIGTSIGNLLLEAGAGVETDGTQKGTVPYFKVGVGIKGL